MNLNILSVLLKDGYKVGHPFQYPKDTTLVYSNFTPRGTRRLGWNEGVIAWAYQYFVKEYLIDHFNTHFFNLGKDEVMRRYNRRITNYLGPVNADHIEALHATQYLPLTVKAVPEGTLLPYRVPALTIYNNKPEFFWLTNMLETLMSNVLWLPTTSATTAFMYRRVFELYAAKTGANRDFIKWQGHDFSMRGMAGIEAACLSGAAHLLSFTGTDTIPAIDFLEQYYGANCEKELIGGSVPATEHSVVSMGLKDQELQTLTRLLTEVYPTGVLSSVSDTWDFWKVITEYLPKLKDVIMGRDGKLVVRPDSGDPVKILCGDPDADTWYEKKGLIECLWDLFGGTKNDNGYKVLDPHIGGIYGDSITHDRQIMILDLLMKKGFDASNVVLGIGSFTYQFATRDTDGWAMKATFGERFDPSDGTVHGQSIYKEPKTDGGIKKSAKGLLCVEKDGKGIFLRDECSWTEESKGILQPIFMSGEAKNIQTLAQIRARVEAQL